MCLPLSYNFTAGGYDCTSKWMHLYFVFVGDEEKPPKEIPPVFNLHLYREYLEEKGLYRGLKIKREAYASLFILVRRKGLEPPTY